MEWKEIKKAFDWDGSWRDLYVFNTTIEDWQCVLNFMRESNYTVLFQHGGEDQSLPNDLRGFFSGESEMNSLLSVNVGGVNINSHFFETDQIEFDIDPREVNSQERAASLFEFMRGIGRALGKPIHLTPENGSHYVIFEYDPERDEIRRVDK